MQEGSLLERGSMECSLPEPARRTAAGYKCGGSVRLKQDQASARRTGTRMPHRTPTKIHRAPAQAWCTESRAAWAHARRMGVSAGAEGGREELTGTSAGSVTGSVVHSKRGEHEEHGLLAAG